jgi:hypothetical protein
MWILLFIIVASNVLAADLGGRAQYAYHWMKEGRKEEEGAIKFASFPPLPSLSENF